MAMSDDSLLNSLLAAVGAAPDDVPLRLHVAELLAGAERLPEALAHCSEALQRAPGDAAALALLQRLSAALSGVATTAQPDFDWSRAEDQVADVEVPEAVPAQHDAGSPVTEDIERPAVRLADVGGMEEVKERLELTFLGPMRNPQMARAFGATMSGGLLLYGPPGCGKTFIARAVAGEMGARFYPIGISDVLDMWAGRSERNLAEIFAAARRNSPCVLFFDELDALGQKRSNLQFSSSLRNTVNQLLSELDSLGGNNDGVFVLAATNHPWDLDSALRRPGRFDRMLLVLPPDAAARVAILKYHLRDRPAGEVDVESIAKMTQHFSGADLAHVVSTAAERALATSMKSGRLVPLTTKDVEAAAREVQPSTGPWFATARNVVTFANTDGSYDDLAAYLRRNKRL
jgi:SpoVK/Ycf46/Vps4 family AAA+-type ATPase